MLRFAIIGFGGLGKVHYKNVIKLCKTRDDIKLTALCDVEESRFSTVVTTNLGGSNEALDLSNCRLYTDAKELFEKEELDFVITALPTYLHEKIAVQALENGLHVFSEKPMARNLEQCRRMLDKAIENQKLLMIGQCLRYWPEYVKLQEYIRGGEYGKVIRAEFSRYSPTPVWSWQNWLLDFEKSGGAALDMHVHDVDFINWAFGKPVSVSSSATHAITKFDSIFTTYKYDQFLVTASCDWGMTDSFPFRHAFLVRFEKAVIEMNGEGMMVYPNKAEPFTPELLDGDAYVYEMCDFIDRIKSKKALTVVTPESAMLTVKIALAEIESAEKGESVNV